MAGVIDVHVLDLTGCETDCALALRGGNKVLMIDTECTLSRYVEILNEFLTDAEQHAACYHGLQHTYAQTA